MLPAHEDARFFESCKPRLLDRYAGQFAVVCGRRLIGVHASLEQALRAAADAFDAGSLDEGAPILISEIAEEARLRVVAEPRAARGVSEGWLPRPDLR